MTTRSFSNESISAGAQSFTVWDLIHYALRVDVRFNNGWEGLTRAQRIATAIGLTSAPATGLALDEGDWQTVCDALRSPSALTGQAAYPISPAHVLVPLCEIVFNAKKEA